MPKITGKQFAEEALKEKWDKVSYDKLDCQAFVEEVLKTIGVRKSDGSCYNWRGSNSMFRNFFSWRGTIEECISKFGSVPIGAFVYMWNKTGQEKVGYKDSLGDAHHVGIYCGNDIVRDSSRSKKNGKYVRNGVGNRSLKEFNMVTLFTGLDYAIENSYNSSVIEVFSIIDGIRNKMVDLEELLNDIFRS